MKCHHCKKNLTDCEIFFKLDHYFCSNTCRNKFTYSFDTQLHLYHPYHSEMIQELIVQKPYHTCSIFASNVALPNE